MTLYKAIMGNRLCRWRLATIVTALCRAHGFAYDGGGEFPPDDEDEGVYVIVNGDPLGWVPYEQIIPAYPWSR